MFKQQTVTAQITSIIKRLSLGLGCGFALASMALLSLNTHAQEFYKWVDSNGSTHYTTTPPPKAKGVKQKGKIDTYGAQKSSSSSYIPPSTVPQTTTAPPQAPATSAATASPTNIPPMPQDGSLRKATPYMSNQPASAPAAPASSAAPMTPGSSAPAAP